MFGEYKLAAYAIIGCILFGIGSAAVLSYNYFVKKAAAQEEQIKARDKVINDQQEMIADKIRQAELAKKYQVQADLRRIESDNRIKQILSMEVKRDAQGNISADDPVLHSLNRMYPGSQVTTGQTDPAPGAAMPKVSASAGTVGGEKEILPE